MEMNAKQLRPTIGALLVAALLAGCQVSSELRDEEAALRLLRDYEMAVATYDGEAAMALFSDDYEGWRGSGREGVGQMVERMAERESTYELDLSESVVTVDGDTVRIEDVGALMGRWEMKSTYVLVRTDDGWKITDIEFQR